jgi:hypothetical protein
MFTGIRSRRAGCCHPARDRRRRIESKHKAHHPRRTLSSRASSELRAANATEYGSSAAVFTRDLERGARRSRQRGAFRLYNRIDTTPRELVCAVRMPAALLHSTGEVDGASRAAVVTVSVEARHREGQQENAVIDEGSPKKFVIDPKRLIRASRRQVAVASTPGAASVRVVSLTRRSS